MTSHLHSGTSTGPVHDPLFHLTSLGDLTSCFPYTGKQITFNPAFTFSSTAAAKGRRSVVMHCVDEGAV